MSVRAIAGLAGYNLLLAVVGLAVLAAFRPTLNWRGFVRLGGLAYMLGLAATMVAATTWAVVGLPLTSTTTWLVLLLVAGAGASVARYRFRRSGVPVTDEGSRGRLFTLTSAVPFAALVVVLESIFRRGRLEGLLGFDEWDSWGPLAKNLYVSGHLQPPFMGGLPGGSYPPGLHTVLASAMHAMGSPDMVTLHLQYWFVALGFTFAVVGLLGHRVRPDVLACFLLLVFVMPNVRGRSVALYGDLPLGYLVATAALLVLLWLEDGSRWPLGLATVVSAGAVLAKREGIVLIGCVFVAGALASWPRRRSTWPRLAAGLAVVSIAYVGWALWLKTNHLPGNGPTSGLSFLADTSRGWDSLVAVVKSLFNWASGSSARRSRSPRSVSLCSREPGEVPSTSARCSHSRSPARP